MFPMILEESRVLASGYNPIPGLRAVAMSSGTCLQIPTLASFGAGSLHFPSLGQAGVLLWGIPKSFLLKPTLCNWEIIAAMSLIGT